MLQIAKRVTVNPDIIIFLNSQTHELSLEFDPNDISSQTLFITYHLEDAIIALSYSISNQHFN